MSFQGKALRTWATLLGLFASASLVSAGATTVRVNVNGSVDLNSDTAAAPVVSVTNTDNTGFSADVQLRGLHMQPVKTRGGEFVQLGWPDASLTGDVGQPAIPVVRRIFVVPQGADVSFETTLSTPARLDLAEAGFTMPVIPVQAPVEKLPGALENAPFNLNPQAYTDNAFPARRVEITKLGIVRERQLYLLEVRPIQYDAANNSLTIWNDVTVNVTFKGGTAPPPAVTAMPFMDRIVLNPNLLGEMRSRGSGNYVIIVASAYESDIAPFAAAKEAQGYNVITHVVAPGTSATTIKSYIESLWGTADSPDYILLVGDTDKIPYWTGGGDGSPATDLPYCCMDGGSDWYPDIALGRFSVRSSSELAAIIDKTLLVEDGPLPDPSYTAKAAFMASVDNYQISEGTHNYVISNHMDPNGIISDKLYQVTYGATTQDVKNSFNDGRIYGVYSGHGGEYSWADGPPFSQSDVRSLTNAGTYPIVWSFACVTGSYQLTECFVETWVRQANKGAVAMWGSSVNSYWTEDDVLERRLFDVIYWDGIRELGPFWDATRMVYLGEMGSGSTTRRYFEMYNLMGDPSLYVPLPGGGSDMAVFPFSDMEAEGQAGGPFTPESKTYSIENHTDAPMTYQVSADVNWLSIDHPAGTIPANGSADVVVSINNNANLLGNGSYEGVISFVNQTTHDGDCTRGAILTVGVPTMIYSWNMDTDPGWTTQGQWAWGHPTGGGGEYGSHDPSNGFTGSNVYGYNLNGDYANNMPEYHLTTDAIDCSDLTHVSLRFYRWLGVEQPTFDHAYIRVSTDGSNWNTVWENSSEVADSSWSQKEVDISDIADNQPTVYIRWTMGTTDSSWRFCGWNIDDVEIWGLEPGAPPCPEDLDGDGVVGQTDLGILLSAYGNNADGDIDGDGDTDQADLGILLSHYGESCLMP